MTYKENSSDTSSSLNFVIVSTSVNFWALGCLRSLFIAANYSQKKIKVYIIHNDKNNELIDLFRKQSKKYINEFLEIKNLYALSNIFDNVNNIFEYKSKFSTIFSYSQILCWLIKYSLPKESYFFIHQDCFVQKNFIINLYKKNIINKSKEYIFLFPEHDPKNYCSLTSPIFFCNTKILNELIINTNDFFWIDFKTNNYKYKTNSEIEKILFNNQYGFDNLKNILKYLFNNYKNEKIAEIINFEENIHLWGSGITEITNQQIDLLKNYFLKFLTKEDFNGDILCNRNLNYKIFLNNLNHYNLEIKSNNIEFKDNIYSYYPIPKLRQDDLNFIFVVNNINYQKMFLDYPYNSIRKFYPDTPIFILTKKWEVEKNLHNTDILEYNHDLFLKNKHSNIEKIIVYGFLQKTTYFIDTDCIMLNKIEELNKYPIINCFGYTEPINEYMNFNRKNGPRYNSGIIRISGEKLDYRKNLVQEMYSLWCNNYTQANKDFRYCDEPVSSYILTEKEKIEFIINRKMNFMYKIDEQNENMLLENLKKDNIIFFHFFKTDIGTKIKEKYNIKQNINSKNTILN